MRSSSEWNATTTSRPPGLSTCSAAARPAASSASSSLTKMRSAWNVRVAGWIAPGRACTTRATISASARVVWIGASRRAATMARATARAWRSSPSVAMMVARSRSEAAATTSAALGPSRPMRMSSGPSCRKENPRSASSSCIEETPRSKTTPSTASWPRSARHRLQIGELVLHQNEPAAGRLHQVGAARDRALVAVDADDVASGRGEDCAAVAAGAEGGVDVDAALTDLEEFDRGAAEHGNVTSQSASDSRCAVAARHHSRAPCGPSAGTREPSCFFNARTFSVASASSARKRPGSQI